MFTIPGNNPLNVGQHVLQRMRPHLFVPSVHKTLVRYFALADFNLVRHRQRRIVRGNVLPQLVYALHETRQRQVEVSFREETKRTCVNEQRIRSASIVGFQNFREAAHGDDVKLLELNPTPGSDDIQHQGSLSQCGVDFSGFNRFVYEVAQLERIDRSKRTRVPHIECIIQGVDLFKTVIARHGNLHVVVHGYDLVQILVMFVLQVVYFGV
mmetsp:Transcript_29809/g.51119  ORF Transcript_29809/g.51119 Transcript_29809/m.51119 type:complete len:211 (-) Transcript_29809:295-927(-)